MRIISPLFRSALKSSALCCLMASAALAGSVTAQTRPDQVFVLDRNGEFKTVSCTVETDHLNEVAVKLRGNPKKYAAAKVGRIVFGTVPESYREAENYLSRSEFDDALASFRLAAEDAEAREAVRAMARFQAADVLTRAATSGTRAAGFAEAATEYERLISDFATSRLVPQARLLGARAKLIAGDAKGAAELGAAVLGDLDSSGRNAYTTSLCITAGLAAAHAHLASGDNEAGATLFKKIQGQLTSMIPEAEGAALKLLKDFSMRAVLGEGWGMLAVGRHGQAVTFFNGKLRAELTADQMYNARLGYAEGLLGQNKYRQAQFEFAAVSALAPTSRDDVAQALVGLARCAQNLSDTDAQERIKGWLESCITQYGDTPAAATARELQAKL